MNTRIKELSEQAWDYVQVCDERYSKTSTQLYDEKFAELIIQECLKVVENQRDPSTLNYSPKARTAEQIKHHFGI